MPHDDTDNWRIDDLPAPATGVLRQRILDPHGQPLSRAAVIGHWRGDGAFRGFFSRALAEVAFTACFWETPPLTRQTLEADYEHVCVDAPALAGVAADDRTFAGHFRQCGGEAETVEFTNLGGDACLIVPCPHAPAGVYPHLAAFLRQAPARQCDALWQHVGRAVAGRVGSHPLWLSTSGLGVYWLHIRLDQRPKYYTHAPYRAAPA